ncbi:da302975-2847-4bb6-be34-3e73d817684f [Thermothielavioides terrestris]|uniref:Da302975-2847-4bb6-be34-3e73d817684f n=1 Tax=Thermothielavioides terrestris TaxID=2587410 RepID=A0A446BT05_9PEZI|nr:da302975-2847-4bb6-be34-3e73d817684f [Thermothielavioides terrestris]
MDPLSALSIAAAGVQFVDFATRLLSDTVEMHKSATGQTDRAALLKRVASDLDFLTSRIQEKRSQFLDTAPAGSPDAIFLEACKQCNEISKELAGVLQTLAVEELPQRRRRSAKALGAAIRGILSDRKITELTTKLETVQRQMQMAALISLWEKAQEHGSALSLASQQQADMVAALDRVDATTRDTANYLRDLASEDSTRLQRQDRQQLIRAMWSAKWSPRARHLDAGPVDTTFTELARVHIVDSLRFPSLEDREDAIPRAHARTFEWLFQPHADRGPDPAPSWSDFPAWLEADTREIYWITGKPGSGKSTLMKFVTRHPRLREHLSVWAGSQQLLAASFYFWNAGTELQKSHEGLLRTILVQCMTQRPDLIPRVCERRWACLEMFGLGAASDLPPWEWDELMECLKGVASQAGREYRLVLFIDGLDEFAGDHTKLVNLVNEVSLWDGVKACVSSRPWNVFNDAFHKKPSLVTQNLTKNDIDKYVKDNFESLPAFNELRGMQPTVAARLLQDIASRAQGVFLWVAVVVRALVSRLTEGDQLAELQATLDELPQDVEELFEAIRRQINARHRAHLARYILLKLASSASGDNVKLPAVTMLLADEDEEGPIHQGLSPMDEAKEASMIAVMRRRLYSRTMGLLEIGPRGEVQFFHRTVLEWVTRNENLAALTSDASADFDPHLELLKALTTEFTSLKLGWMVVRTLQKLVDYAYKTARLNRYDESQVLQMLLGSPPNQPRRVNDQLDMVRLAARSAVFPFVAAKIDKFVLRNHEDLFALLLNDIVFGYTQFSDTRWRFRNVRLREAGYILFQEDLEGKCDSSSSSGQSTSKHKGSSTSSKQPCVCKGSPSCKDPRHCKSTTGSSAELQCSACRAAGCPSASTSTYPPGNSGSYGAGSGTDTDYDTGYATGLSAGYDAGYAAGYGAVYGLDNYSAY